MLTLVFDIDGTVCLHGSKDYSQAVPLPHAIARVNAAYDRGHKIVFQTARYMARCKGDAQAAREAGERVTRFWLAQHGVKYHELYFGKPSGDLYADDRGCRLETEADWATTLPSLLDRLESERGM